MTNLRHRELRQAMGEDFLDWAKNRFDESADLGKKIIRKEAAEAFTNYNASTKRYPISSVIFGRRLKFFCQYMGYHLNAHKPHEKTGETFSDWIKKHEGDSFIGQPDKSNGTEFITISKDGAEPKAPASDNPFADDDPFSDPSLWHR